MQDKIRGCLLGGAIGDALGYQIEFDIGVREKQVTRFSNDCGIISDDTQMTLFTANAILWRATHFKKDGQAIGYTEAVYHGYLDWLDTQMKTNKHKSISWIKDIPALNKQQAPGNTCLSALQSGKMGTIDNKINNSKGCGSVMRIAPCAIITTSPALAGNFAAECAAITHGHPQALISSYICSAIIHNLINNNITIKQALNNSLNLLRTKTIFNSDQIEDFISLVEKAVYLSKQAMSDIDAIRKLGEGWVADEALAIAIYSCLKYPNNFEDAVVCAVNHDGDSDSTGAIAGNIIGAALGFDKIPQYYATNVELKDVILTIADHLTVIKTSDFFKSRFVKHTWKKQYIDCRY